MNIQIKKAKFTKKIIEKIIELDKGFYCDNNSYDASWYHKRYSNKNFVYLLQINGETVGYFNLINVTKKLFDDICNLKYSDDYNFPEDEVNVKSDYYYLPSILVKKEFRKYSLHLIYKLYKIVENIENLCVIAISDEGKQLAGFSLKKVGILNNCTIFAKRKDSN